MSAGRSTEEEVREVNGTRVIRKENTLGVPKDYVEVSIGTTVVEVRRRLRNPLTDRREDLTKLSDDGYLKQFLALLHHTESSHTINLDESPVLSFDADRWQHRRTEGQHVLLKQEAESKLGDRVLEDSCDTCGGVVMSGATCPDCGRDDPQGGDD